MKKLKLPNVQKIELKKLDKSLKDMIKQLETLKTLKNGK